MIKNISLAIVILVLSLTCRSLSAQNMSKEYNPEAFEYIVLESVGNIIFTQSDKYSCRIEGPTEYVENVKVTVAHDRLVITHDKGKNNKAKNITFYITAPDLKEVKLDGVGGFNASDILKLKDVTFILNGVGNFNVKSLFCANLKMEVNGVGNMNLNVHCKYIDATLSGVGNIDLSGKADSASLKRAGIGKIQHKKLKCSSLKK